MKVSVSAIREYVFQNRPPELDDAKVVEHGKINHGRFGNIDYEISIANGGEQSNDEGILQVDLNSGLHTPQTIARLTLLLARRTDSLGEGLLILERNNNTIFLNESLNEGITLSGYATDDFPASEHKEKLTIDANCSYRSCIHALSKLINKS